MIYNKERPYRFDKMVGQAGIVNNLQAQSKEDNFGQFYIFYGQYGSGKTTSSEILKRAINCTNKDENGNPCLECEACRAVQIGTTDIIDIDGASNNSVEDIRALKEVLTYEPVLLKKKIIVIDEVHMLSTGAFNALLKMLEEPPEYVVFILCTTEINKIPFTVRSRAFRYCFEQIQIQEIEIHLKQVAKKYEIQIEEEAASLIARTSNGSMRDALSLMEQASILDGVVTEKKVAEILGISNPIYLFQLLEQIMSNDVGKAISMIGTMVEKGKNLFLLATDLLNICSDAIVASYNGTDTIANTQNYRHMLENLIALFSEEQFCVATDGLMEVRTELRNMPSKTTFVCGIIRMSSMSKVALLHRIESLEEKICSLMEKEKVKQGAEVAVLVENEKENHEEYGETKERKEEMLPNSIEEKEEVKEQNELDFFDLLDDFGFFAQKEETSSEVLSESSINIEETKEVISTENFYHDIMVPLYRKEPILESIFELGAKLSCENNTYRFELSHKNLYRIWKVYEEHYNVPFQVYYKENL